jgi:hypothetical protein
MVTVRAVDDGNDGTDFCAPDIETREDSFLRHAEVGKTMEKLGDPAGKTRETKRREV